MSTYYGIMCVGCNSFSPCSDLTASAVSRAISTIPAMVALWKTRKQFFDALQDVDLSVYWCNDFHNFLEWLVEHEGHALIVVDEYGREHPEIKQQAARQ